VTATPASGPRLTHPATPFATAIRVRPEAPIRLGAPGEPVVALRVEMPEVWDAVRIDAPLTTTVRDLKIRALAELYPDAANPDAFVMKFAGWEIRDESIPVAGVGARDGAIFLLTFRLRRPVRS
jgi:hypothetical protein